MFLTSSHIPGPTSRCRGLFGFAEKPNVSKSQELCGVLRVMILHGWTELAVMGKSAVEKAGHVPGRTGGARRGA